MPLWSDAPPCLNKGKFLILFKIFLSLRGRRLPSGAAFLLSQPRSQHCLSTALAQAVSISTLIGCHLNDESVRKVLKFQFRYEISNGLQLQSTKVQGTVVQFIRKRPLGNEMFN